MSERVKIYKSHTDDYHDAFQVFLDHTDQKVQARRALDQIIGKLPVKQTFIDAGAGNGRVTAWFTDLFERTIAIEPSDSLRRELAEACPRAEVSGDSILDARISTPGDFVLASHVFYYIDQKEWMKNLERLTSWLAPGGILTVIIQNHETDCMKMLEHFFHRSFDLKRLTRTFESANNSHYNVKMEKVASHVTAPDLDTAVMIAEFMLNLLPITDAPLRRDLRDYVAERFVWNGTFRFSCHQDFLQISRR